jgi:hypothetical protein
LRANLSTKKSSTLFPLFSASTRWLASKAVKAEWKAMGRKPQYAEVSEIAAATNVYFIEHREQLLREARAHPVAVPDVS